MKIIIDANVSSEFNNKTAEAKAIVEWLSTRGFLSTGGLNLEELNKTKIRMLVIELLRSGRGAVVPVDQICAAMQNLDITEVTSDEPHVLALAIAGGARTLYTRDDALIQDFKNKTLIDNPRGRCYKEAAKHKHLLC